MVYWGGGVKSQDLAEDWWVWGKEKKMESLISSNFPTWTIEKTVCHSLDGKRKEELSDFFLFRAY